MFCFWQGFATALLLCVTLLLVLLIKTDIIVMWLWRRMGKARTAHKPNRIILIRHGESEGNVDESVYERIPDHRILLTHKGEMQARETGQRLRDITGDETVTFFVSPYTRTKQTFQEIFKAFAGRKSSDTRVHYDPRLREQDFANLQIVSRMRAKRKMRAFVGRFFYRFPGGESGCDVFERASSFLDTLFREISNPRSLQNIVVVSHGLFIRLLLMRYFHWSVEYFERVWNLRNCEMVILERDRHGKFTLTSKLRMDSEEAHVEAKRKSLPNKRPPSHMRFVSQGVAGVSEDVEFDENDDNDAYSCELRSPLSAPGMFLLSPSPSVSPR